MHLSCALSDSRSHNCDRSLDAKTLAQRFTRGSARLEGMDFSRHTDLVAQAKHFVGILSQIRPDIEDYPRLVRHNRPRREKLLEQPSFAIPLEIGIPVVLSPMEQLGARDSG
jgi:hypothetical protein